MMKVRAKRSGAEIVKNAFPFSYRLGHMVSAGRRTGFTVISEPVPPGLVMSVSFPIRRHKHLGIFVSPQTLLITRLYSMDQWQ